MPISAFVPDDHLDYARLATPFAPGSQLILDEAYRRAHLPLVAPHHPRVIREDGERGYFMGRHETIWSLVIPIDWQALIASAAFRAMQDEMETGPLRDSIDWDSFKQRRDRLHATIAGNLSRGAPPAISDEWRAAFRAQRPFRVALRGLFSGNINLGRLYLKLYPEKRDGENAIRTLQRALHRPETGLYVVGLYNLNDDLNATQTFWLSGFLSRHSQQEWLIPSVDSLHLLGARDDLALDSEVAEVLRLG
ncbi:MAG: hypothetical protein J0L51_12480 [Rhizobiales bacterium]|nr:hypothetical protein [Hyphomicrobiales bacterium]